MGALTDDWDFLPPKKIKDPEAKKPDDWVDQAKLDDPEDAKPEDWDKPEHIADPDATKPEDWDDEMDGEWEPPMIDNPEYKGEWKPRQIDNPDYKGPWVHPEIDNPEYNPDDAKDIGKYAENCKIGFDLWQVKSGTIFFEEKFDTLDAWVQSTHKGAEAGKFELSAGKFYGDEKLDQGAKTSQDARFYGMSAAFPPMSNVDKPLVIQFTVKHEQNIDCGGGYIKLFDCKLDQADMHGESPYNVMFGPDICGPGTKKVHVIFEHKGKNHLIKKDIRCKDDVFTHLYTLIVNTDGTYEVLIDNESAQTGSLTDDWDFLPPKKIKDPEAKKPDDWVDQAKLDDPEDAKPEDWDKPEHIADPDATKPEDWDDEMDGEWEPPMIDNPEYKGEWKPRQIDNPDYKGPW